MNSDIIKTCVLFCQGSAVALNWQIADQPLNEDIIRYYIRNKSTVIYWSVAYDPTLSEETQRGVNVSDSWINFFCKTSEYR